MTIIPNTLSIRAYMHCGKCLLELPDGESPASYSKLSVGWTDLGIQIWCQRHGVNVMHVDFEGMTHKANRTAVDPAPATTAVIPLILSAFGRSGAGGSNEPGND